MEEENEEFYLDSTTDENTADDYETIRSTYCCSEMCLSRLPLKDIVAACKKFQSLTAVTKQQWILDYLDIHGSVDEENSHVFSFNVGIQRVCQDAWCQVIMLPRSTFYDTRKKFIDGTHVVTKQHDRTNIKAQQCIVWLEDFVAQYGDKLPDSSKIHLPTWCTKVGIQTRNGVQLVSLSYLCRLWREELRHIAIPQLSRFSKCDLCTEVKAKLAATKDAHKREKYLLQRQKHLAQQNTERRKYYSLIQKARRQPDDYLSLIIDGMDKKRLIFHIFGPFRSRYQICGRYVVM